MELYRDLHCSTQGRIINNKCNQKGKRHNRRDHTQIYSSLHRQEKISSMKGVSLLSDDVSTGRTNSDIHKTFIKKNKVVREARFAEMRQTREHMKAELKIIDKIIEEYYFFEGKDLKEYCYDLIYRRLEEGLPLRAYFIEKTAEYLRRYNNSKKKTPELDNLDSKISERLGFVFELVLVIQYLHNQVLDKKLGVNTPEKVNKNLIASNLLREILFRYIERAFPNRGKKSTNSIQNIVRKYVGEVFLYTDLGQRIDKEHSHYEAYCKANNINLNSKNKLFKKLERRMKVVRKIIDEQVKGQVEKKEFVELYFRRIFLTNGYLFTASVEMLTEIYGYNNEVKNNTINYATAYGLALQVVNDNCDFVLGYETAGKNTDDSLSDLRNKNRFSENYCGMLKFGKNSELWKAFTKIC